MRIIGISGVWCNHDPLWNSISPAFKDRFVNSEFIVEEESMQNPLDFLGLCRFSDHILELHDDGEDIMLVGHSMGGIVATAICNRFKQSKVKIIATLFTPHTGLGIYPSLFLNVPSKLLAPIITFQSARDIAIFGTEHPQSKRHVVLDCDHEGEVIAANRSIADQVALETHGVLYADTVSA